MRNKIGQFIHARVESIISEHAGIRSELACFKELVNNAEKGSIVARSSFSDAAITFVESEWRHMELERTRLFPVALALLSVDDWDYIEGLAPSVEDTLFGDALSAPMRRLHELLSECDSIETTARLLGATSLP
jgi:hemerythrin-like domain-containing protein